MECLSDFGTVYYFSIQTLSTGLYKAWLGYGDMTMTSLLAIFIFLIAIFLALVDRFLKPEYYRITLNRSKSDEVHVVGVKKFFIVYFFINEWAVWICCTIYFSFEKIIRGVCFYFPQALRFLFVDRIVNDNNIFSYNRNNDNFNNKPYHCLCNKKQQQ